MSIPRHNLAEHTFAAKLDTERVIRATTASVPAGSFIVDHEALRVRNPQKYLFSCVKKQNQKLLRQYKMVSSPLTPQPTKSVFANRKTLSGTNIPISNESHSFHMELFCVSCMVPNQQSFVSMTHSIKEHPLSLSRVTQLRPE